MVKRIEISFKAFLACVLGDIIFYLAKGELRSDEFGVLAFLSVVTFLVFLWQVRVMLRRGGFTKI